MATLGFNVIVYIVMIQLDAVTEDLRLCRDSASPDGRVCLQL